MLNVLLVLALAQVTALGISIDEDGFVTLNESPEVYEQERKNLRMLEEAYSAYREYREKQEGDLANLIDMHKAILESGMVLAPAVHQTITARLAELSKNYAKGVTSEDRQRITEIQHRMSNGTLPQEDFEYIHASHLDSRRRNEMLNAIAYSEETLARMPEDAYIEASRLLVEMAMMSQRVGDRKASRDSGRYYLRARQKALEEVRREGLHQQEARTLAELGLKSTETMLQQQGDVELCRELKQTYSDDSELTSRLEALITALTAP